MIVWGYYGFTLDICVSVCPSVYPSVIGPSICFYFPDDNLSKRQWIFTKLGMCIDIVEIWFGIANGQILSNFYRVICPHHNNDGVLYYSESFYFNFCIKIYLIMSVAV